MSIWKTYFCRIINLIRKQSKKNDLAESCALRDELLWGDKNTNEDTLQCNADRLPSSNLDNGLNTNIEEWKDTRPSNKTRAQLNNIPTKIELEHASETNNIQRKDDNAEKIEIFQTEASHDINNTIEKPINPKLDRQFWLDILEKSGKANTSRYYKLSDGLPIKKQVTEKTQPASFKPKKSQNDEILNEPSKCWIGHGGMLYSSTGNGGKGLGGGT
ncbi:hypothetical protein LZP69_14310 [Shewanella sp. AS1]|uniref:hypothetical protein n=1 Tax=Shewanella sp. AS1 TaxID=2907626 RepID=UPI001F2924CA|nr:hypothetical protein [Shewanella sp. AS1]MCE9680328.1 hypothetical protein [Shewanella sp. AS1]